MFNALRSFIKENIATSDDPDDEHHVMHLASAALLLEVSRADFDIQDEEIIEIANALQKRFNFNKEEVDSLIEVARTEHESHVSIYPFVKIINESCTPEEKKLLLQDLWKVAYADKVLDKYEDYQIRKIAELLYLSHSDFIQTKLSVVGD